MEEVSPVPASLSSLNASHSVWNGLTRAVILAADQTNAAYGVLVYQSNLDKIAELTSHSAMAVSGPNCDLVNFTEFIQKNFQLYELRNDGTKLSMAAQANFCRNELATALRKGPFQVNTLLGGYDATKKTQALYWLDYLGTLQKVPYGCQGVATNFCLSVMDRAYRSGQTEEQALALIKSCIKETQLRFLPSQPNFIIKCIDAKGVRTMEFGADPADN
jgi:20S proteasome subunit beta 4